jgi:hypothetical protein
MNRIWSAALVATVAVSLAGCSAAASTSGSSGGSSAASSSQAPVSTPTPTATPVSGKTITGTGYDYVVPKDWGLPSGVTAPSGADSFAASLHDTDGFADNVNVVTLGSGKLTPEIAETQGQAGLKQVGAKDIRVADRVTVAGEPAAHITAVLSNSGAKYQVEQVYLGHENKAYVVTFSFNTTVSQADRDAVITPILTSWKWA